MPVFIHPLKSEVDNFNLDEVDNFVLVQVKHEIEEKPHGITAHSLVLV